MYGFVLSIDPSIHPLGVLMDQLIDFILLNRDICCGGADDRELC